MVLFEGLHDTDPGWLKDVRSSNPAVKIVPRLLFDGWSQQDLNSLFSSEMAQTSVVQKITDFVKSLPIEGIVCEILLQVGLWFLF